MLWYIEALRSLAVLSVIIYHANKEFLPGGFLGVDVFFVVSGYLMAYLVLKNKTSNFNTIEFLWRRFSRLAPAMLILIVLVVLLNVLLQPQFYISEYLKSAFTSLLYISNINFWFGSGYFNIEQQYDPLLHTWTLGVEFQYYLVFSIAIYLMKNINEKYLAIIFSIASIISFFLNIYFSSHFSAIFYNLPTRGWEFGIGAVCAFMFTNKPNIKIISKFESEMIIYACLMLIIILFFNYGLEFNRLYYTGSICFLTAGILVLGKLVSERSSSTILNYSFINIGKLSYTVYLFHYPVIVFIEPYISSKIFIVYICFIISFGIAYLLYPIEKKSRIYLYSLRGGFSKFFALSLYLLVPLSIHVFNQSFINLNSDLLSKRLPSDQLRVQELYTKEISQRSNAIEEFNKQNKSSCWKSYEYVTESFKKEFSKCFTQYGNAIIIIGDSHSEGLLLTLSNNVVNRENYPFVFGINHGGCRYSLGSQSNCFSGVDEFIEKNNDSIKKIIYHQAGFYLVERKGTNAVGRVILDSTTASNADLISPSKESVNLVKNKLTELAKSNKIIWVGPWIDPFISRRKAISSGCSNPAVVEEWISSTYKNLDSKLKNISNIKYVSLIDLLDIEYKNEFLTCEELYWVDTDHMSVTGHRHFANRLDLGDIIK